MAVGCKFAQANQPYAAHQAVRRAHRLARFRDTAICPAPLPAEEEPVQHEAFNMRGQLTRDCEWCRGFDQEFARCARTLGSSALSAPWPWPLVPYCTAAELHCSCAWWLIRAFRCLHGPTCCLLHSPLHWVRAAAPTALPPPSGGDDVRLWRRHPAAGGDARPGGGHRAGLRHHPAAQGEGRRSRAPCALPRAWRGPVAAPAPQPRPC